MQPCTLTSRGRRAGTPQGILRPLNEYYSGSPLLYYMNPSGEFVYFQVWFPGVITTIHLTLTAFIAPFSAEAGSCLWRKSSKNPLYTPCSAPNGRKTQLAIKSQIFLSGVGRDKKKRSKSKYWPYIHQVDTNMTPNE